MNGGRRRFLLLPALVAVILLLAPRPAAAIEEADAKRLIATLVGEVIAKFAGETLPRPERERVMRDMIVRYADPATASEDMLGRHWARASVAEREAFQKLLVDYVIASWVESVSDVADGTRVELGQAEPKGARLLIHSIATTPGDTPNAVAWWVATVGDRLVITDVEANGVSMVNTMKADFAAVLRANGFKLDALMAAMRKKVDGR